MNDHNLEEKVRTSRGEPATGGGASGHFEHGIEHALVKADGDADGGGEQVTDHVVCAGRGKRPRRLTCLNQSALSSAKLACEAPGRAMVMR